MTKLEKLYSIIENSREVGVKLSSSASGRNGRGHHQGRDIACFGQ